MILPGRREGFSVVGYKSIMKLIEILFLFNDLAVKLTYLMTL